jgi:hypothetical protein
MVAYATRQDVYDLGLGAQAFASLPRPVPAADIDLTTGTIRLRAHGMTAADIITFEVTSGGHLFTGASAFVAYSPIIVSADLFRISGFTTPIADPGKGWSVVIDPERRIDRLCEERSGWIDEHLTAEEPPLRAPFPSQVVGLCARLVARYGTTTLALENAAYRTALDRVEALREADERLLATWLAGKPINPRAKDQNSVPDNAAIAEYTRPPTTWRTGAL